MENYRILILTEDRYGVDFFKKLIKRLKTNGLIKKSRRIDVEWLHGKCNPKLERILRSKLDIPLKLIIIVADAEGYYKNKIIKTIEKHIPSPFKNIVRYIIFSYSIEELICEGLGIRWRGNTPIDCLNRHLRKTRKIDYEKYMLPSFATKINLNKLRGNKEFNKFLNYIIIKE